ncbi:hypothetical protein B0J18DRAFT_416544 [Chaetomium sp. MPI-SDFR-AT-0129]|nr:hypothetical protein B0J18DRAFT_416544 [Chaetomium sp. MPI-SDFR-AT-0129]
MYWRKGETRGETQNDRDCGNDVFGCAVTCARAFLAKNMASRDEQAPQAKIARHLGQCQMMPSRRSLLSGFPPSVFISRPSSGCPAISGGWTAQPKNTPRLASRRLTFLCYRRNKARAPPANPSDAKRTKKSRDITDSCLRRCRSTKIYLVQVCLERGRDGIFQARAPEKVPCTGHLYYRVSYSTGGRDLAIQVPRSTNFFFFSPRSPWRSGVLFPCRPPHH